MTSKADRPAIARDAMTYRVSANGEWATIVVFEWRRENDAMTGGGVRHSGEILIHSGYGSWGQSWSHCGQPFRQFLLDVEFDYMFGKLAPQTLRIFDGPQSFKALCKSLTEMRRRGELRKATVRMVWTEVLDEQTRLETSTSDFVQACDDIYDRLQHEMNRLRPKGEFMVPRADQRALYEFFSEPWERVSLKKNPQYVGFWRDLWPVFRARLEEELKEKTA